MEENPVTARACNSPAARNLATEPRVAESDGPVSLQLGFAERTAFSRTASDALSSSLAPFVAFEFFLFERRA
jgi:hypothetical protein